LKLNLKMIDKNKKKLLGIAYVRLVQDEKGEVNFDYGYAIDTEDAFNLLNAISKRINFIKKELEVIGK